MRDDMTAQSQFLDVNGTRVHVHVEGSGPDLILLHGAGANLRDFTFSMTERLQHRYRVIAIDRPGHGLTDRIKTRAGDAESLDEQADLVHGVATQLGADRALVLGQSYGGSVSLAYALRYPDAVQGLIVVAGASNPWDGGLDLWYRVSDTWLGQSLMLPIVSALATRGQVANSIEGIFTPDPVPQGYVEHLGVELSTRTSQLQASAGQINRLLRDIKAQVSRYGEISDPVEIVHGTADQTVPYVIHAVPLSGQIPGAVLTRLDGAGHMPQHSRESEVIGAIDRVAKRAGLH